MVLDVECLDRIYLNAMCPPCSSGQVFAFLHHHLGMPFPSPGGDRSDRQQVGQAVPLIAG